MRWQPGLAAALLGASVILGDGLGRALACAICLSAVSVTTGQKLDAADQIALASEASDGERFQLAQAIKGAPAIGTVVEASSDHDHAHTVPAQTGALYLLARNGLSGNWTNFGATGVNNAAWLREFAKTGDGLVTAASPSPLPVSNNVQAAPDNTNWRQRLFLIGPYLQSQDSLAAEIAFEELARAPYESVRWLKPMLDAGTIRAWLDDPALSPLQSPYFLLLGVAGGSEDAAMLEGHLDKARTSHDATHLAAMLAAYLELSGPSRIQWITENYLTDRSRSLPEIEATLLAFYTHGRAGGVISRQQVVHAFRTFIRERRPMAGFVAPYLAEWKAWDAVPDYIQVLQSKAVKDPAGQFAILAYLRNSPDGGAQSAAAAFIAKPH